VFDGDLAALPGEGAPSRPGRREDPQLLDGEVPLLEEPQHDPTDLTGGTEETNAHGARLSPPRTTPPMGCPAPDRCRPSPSARAPVRARSAEERGVEGLDGLLGLVLAHDAGDAD